MYIRTTYINPKTSKAMEEKKNFNEEVANSEYNLRCAYCGADMSHLIYGYEDNIYVFFLCQVCGNINIFPKSVIGK